MNIGITCRLTEENTYDETRNSIALDWINYFNKLNLNPIIIPNGLSDVKRYLNILNLDGIILSGGNNVDPSLYGSDIKLNSVYEMRDTTEFNVLSYCINKKIPVIGVCRGMFIANVFFKGKITHNISNHVNVNHKIKITKFNNFLQSYESVNSYHKHAITNNDLANNFKIFASTNDGIIEGIFDINKLIFGFQWHPERDAFNQRISSLIIGIFKKNLL